MRCAYVRAAETAHWKWFNGRILNGEATSQRQKITTKIEDARERAAVARSTSNLCERVVNDVIIYNHRSQTECAEVYVFRVFLHTDSHTRHCNSKNTQSQPENSCELCWYIFFLIRLFCFSGVFYSVVGWSVILFSLLCVLTQQYAITCFMFAGYLIWPKGYFCMHCVLHNSHFCRRFFCCFCFQTFCSVCFFIAIFAVKRGLSKKRGAKSIFMSSQREKFIPNI